MEGFFLGAGFDAILCGIAKWYVPQLMEPSPIKIPGYDPEGVHWDDVIVLATSLGAAAFGGVKKDFNLLAKGLAMALGHYIMSAWFQNHPPGVTVQKTIKSEFLDIIKVD